MRVIAGSARRLALKTVEVLSMGPKRLVLTLAIRN